MRPGRVIAGEQQIEPLLGLVEWCKDVEPERRPPGQAASAAAAPRPARPTKVEWWGYRNSAKAKRSTPRRATSAFAASCGTTNRNRIRRAGAGGGRTPGRL